MVTAENFKCVHTLYTENSRQPYNYKLGQYLDIDLLFPQFSDN